MAARRRHSIRRSVMSEDQSALFEVFDRVLIDKGPKELVPMTAQSGPIGPDGTEPGGGHSGFLPVLLEFGLRGGFVRTWEDSRQEGRAFALVFAFGSPSDAQSFLRWAQSIPTLASHVQARTADRAEAVSCIEPGGCFVAFVNEGRVFWLQADRYHATRTEDAIRILEELAARQREKLRRAGNQ
jgi:hypothetical protein